MKAGSNLTIDPLQTPQKVVQVHIHPETIRLPQPGQRCPYTGMTRSALNSLILPTVENPKPQVRSFVLRQRGARTGIRLIDYQSLIGFIQKHEEKGLDDGRQQI